MMKEILIAFLVILLVGTASATVWVNGTGCWTATVDLWTVVKWNTTGTSSWNPPSGVTEVDYLILGGGGAGGMNVNGAGGGGGAGGLLTSLDSPYYKINVTPGTPVQVIVGAGGSGTLYKWGGQRGLNSTFNQTTAHGGGGGVNETNVTNSGGGSGGGAAPITTAGLGIAGEGNNGGNGVASVKYPSGGGGGKGREGYPGIAATGGGMGGDGVINNITGENLKLAGGGGGSADSGIGGAGGNVSGTVIGGDGKIRGAGAGGNAVAETGSGGGGAENAAGGSGSSGLVVIRYTSPPNNNPIVQFTSNVTSGVTPPNVDVQFNDTTIHTPTAWNWSFTNVTPGNNTQTWWSTLQNATQTFGNGNWKINLNVTNASGFNVSTANYWINVSSGIPAAAFHADDTTPVTGQTVLFIDDSTSASLIDSYYWEFGEGTWITDNSTLQNPAKVYSAVGNYTVRMRASNATYGGTWLNRTDYITVHGSAGFNQQDLVMAPQYTLTVTYVDSLTNMPIPTVTVLDSTGYNATTTAGVFSHSYPYSIAVLYASSTGYTGVASSFVMDGDRTEIVRMVKASDVTASTSTWYVPLQVRLITVNQYGNPVSGVDITGTPIGFTAPENWSHILIGIQPDVNMMGTTLLGTTGDDGSWVAPMLSSYQYRFTFINATAGINQVSQFYPSDSEYRIWLTIGGTINNTYAQINGTTLTFTEPNASFVTMGMTYQDTSGLTQNVTFSVISRSNNTVVYTRTNTTGFTTSAVLAWFTTANVRGESFNWKYVAYRSDGSVLAQGWGVDMKGPSGVGIDFGLPLGWYQWISISILFLMASMASQRTKQFWVILIPVFAAIFLWAGWFTGQSNSWGIIVFVAVLGGIIYLKSSLREKFGG